MNAKKINWMFVLIFFTYIAASLGLSVYDSYAPVSAYVLYLINELIFIVPMVIFVLATRTSWRELVPVRRIKTSTAWMTVLFTMLCVPLVTVINAFTMFFVENEVVASSDTIMQLPFVASFFLIAIYAPVCEELVFRGVVFESLRKNLNLMQAMVLSAVFFGLAHMNLNQAAYALVLGIVLVLLREATGSLLATMLFHIVFNGYTVVLMYLEEGLLGDGATSSAAQMLLSQHDYQIMLLQTVSVYLVIAAVTTALAACVLAWIARNENRVEALTEIWTRRRENRGKVFSISFFLVLVLFVGLMLVYTLML